MSEYANDPYNFQTEWEYVVHFEWFTPEETKELYQNKVITLDQYQYAMGQYKGMGLI